MDYREKQKKSARLFLIAGLISILVIGILIIIPYGFELQFIELKTGNNILALPIKAGELFTLNYIHSVNRKPIWEVHSIDKNGHISIEEERFVSFSAGMGHWKGHGRHVMRGKYQVIEGIHMPVRNFILRVGSKGVDHTIIWRGHRFNLSNLVPGKAVLIKTEKINLLKYIWKSIFIYPKTIDSWREK